MEGAALIMNDDVDGAEKRLAKGQSSFHKLGRGLVTFLRATYGFESEFMKEASERLADAEASASSDHAKAIKNGGAYESTIYATGSEYALVTVEAQIMAAVVGVLNESLTESIRGFYKIRKAFATLEGLLAMETKYANESLAKQSAESLGSVESSPSTVEIGRTPVDLKTAFSIPPSNTVSTATSGSNNDRNESDEEEFIDANEELPEAPTPTTYEGHLEIQHNPNKLSNPSLLDPVEVIVSSKNDKENLPETPSMPTSSSHQLLNLDPDSSAFSNPLDGFVHSGINLCFGILLLLISTIPPAFSKLLSIVGFRGDREKGILLLWQSSKFHNIHGAMAALCLLVWYNVLVGSCDIVPDPPEDSTPQTQVEGYPALRLRNLLSATSQRYPKSQLWKLERARMASSQRQLSKALDILKQPSTSSLKQAAGLHMFERSLNAMYAHQHRLCYESFLTCVDLNNWSQAMYYYNAGASHLALYRNLRNSNPKEADKHAKAAESYFQTAPTHTGKKRIMARQLPFDIFVSRKIQKWEQRAKDWNCSFVDAIGVSPTEEMCYLWNGYRKMSYADLEESLNILSWSDNLETNPQWKEESADEGAILALLRAAIYRHLRKHEKAKALLQKEVLNLPKTNFKGPLRDDWPQPVAHYEMGVNYWMERSQYQREYGTQLVVNNVDDLDLSLLSEKDPRTMTSTTAETETETETETNPNVRSRTSSIPLDIEKDRKLVSSCKSHIEKARNWESYGLESRIGIKVTNAVDAIGKWEKRHGGQLTI
ncbi:putative mitochondrial outer membrane protein iml2 [Phaeomoniella chlamydospora]|uniref:Inclusion body clearance protein IML2 n=1 Tax=Phaeomoniella chlamydospora TaxID=158046 RepID=A0A0G2EAJ5_PHACM|nr:putative mitochondrial outer membrane protein iml2 [Phaeomoniella chlamydospora]